MVSTSFSRSRFFQGVPFRNQLSLSRKFSGDESFIETDGSGPWPNAGPSSDTGGNRPETEAHDSHINPKAGNSKL